MEAELFHSDRLMEGETLTKVTVAFRNLVDASKENESSNNDAIFV